MTKAKPVTRRSNLGLMALEPRWMFDGAAAVDAAHAAPDAAAKSLIPDAPAPVQVRAADPSKDNGKKEVMFVDTSVAGYQALEAAVKPGIEIEEIDGSKSGLAQIAKWAETHSGYDSISIISHGAEAAVQIGTDTLIDPLLANATVQAELAQIGHSLNAGGDLLLYGCDVAKGDDGQRFITDLAAATGADVAASTDTTGSADRGGDWTLERATGDIHATAFDGHDWNGDLGWTTVGNPASASGSNYYESLAIASNGTLYLAYEDDGDTGKLVVMKYTTAGGWTTVGAAGGISAGQTNGSTLAISPTDGSLYVAYNDWDAGFLETVRKFDGTNWTTVGNAGFSDGNTDYTSFAIASDGTPYVAYKDDAHSNKATVMKFNGTNWVAVGGAGITAGGADYESLVIGADGKPYLAYCDRLNANKATVMKFNGTNWVPVGSAGFSADGAEEISLSINSGTLYVAYSDWANDYKATVMKFDGTNWVAVGTPGFSGGTAYTLSLAFATDGTPYLAYRDDANSNKATVMTYSDASGWSVVGTAGFTSNTSYLSFAISSDGTPYVAYADGDNLSAAAVKSFAPGPANTAPTFVTATAQSLSVDYNSAAVDLKTYLHASDTDSSQMETWTQSVAPSNGTLSFTSATASSGSTDITPGGTITYTPTTGYSGTDTFTIQVSDGNGGTATRVFNVTVAANTAPTYVTGTAQSLSLPFNSAAVDLKSYLHASDSDASQTETWSQGTAPSHGTLSFSSATASSGGADITPGGTITYTPTAGYSGTDTFTIQVSDGTDTVTRTFNVTVAANIAPTYVTGTAQSLSLPFNSAAVDLKSYLHASDSDASQTETWSQGTAPSHGTLSFSSATASSGGADITPGGTITYTPTAGYSGADTFTIRVSDGTATVTRTFNVTVAAYVAPVTESVTSKPPAPVVTPPAPVVVAPPPAPAPVAEPSVTIVRDNTPASSFTSLPSAPSVTTVSAAGDPSRTAPVVASAPVISVVTTAQFTAATVADGGFRVPVVTAAQGGPAVEGLVALRPEIQAPVITDGPVRIALPLDAFAHTRSDAVVTLNAVRINGQPLPSWLAFDSRSGTLTGQPPADFKGTMVVRVIARDDRGQEATITVRINGQPEKTGAVRDGKPQKLADARPGKLAFTQQLKLAARFAAIRFS